ncbi:von Willebrand factor type A domain protein [Roseburia sp. CAG:471]|nr:von Willebrand factor type A domain protein [Roseburia sp. CAG:471]
MKSKGKKRLLALVLCMVVAISNSSFIFASETGQTEYPQEAEVQTQDEAVANDMDVAAYAADEGQAVAEEQTAPVEQVTAEPETTVAAPAEQPTAETPAAEQPTTEAPAAETPAAQEPATVSEGTTTTSENTNAAVGEAQTPQGEENGETVTYNQKMDLKQDFTDELGNVVATVSAEIPEGAFQVGESSQITMEVNTLTDTEKTRLENLMKEKIPAEKELGQYVAYNIRFKVDGTETESLQPIKITMTGDKTQIDDVENATVFYLDPADPTVPGDKDELEEIIQRTALIKSLQEAGQSIDNIDEDYDLSDIALGADGAAEKIQLEGRTSAIYGCYVENTPKEDVTDDGVSDEEPAGDETVSDEILNPATLAADTTGNAVKLNEDNGKLTASYTGGTDEYGFVWYRSINGGEYTAQEPTEYTSNTGKKLGYDIKTDGSELYIALNGGALGYKNNGQENTSVKYQVKVFQKRDIGNNGLPTAEAAAVATSREYVVTSYYEVRNGGFETPSMKDSTSSNQQYTNDNYKNLLGVWQSTGRGSNGTSIEIVNTRVDGFRTDYAWYGSDGAAEGEQFAELNCDAEGALYQDVLTTPGETLNYKFAHRARGSYQNSTSESDSMYVLIMSTKLAQGITTHSQVRNVINNLAAYPGATVTKYTSDDQQWSRYAGTYNVPEGSDQYSTRFFFVSGSRDEVASKDNTVGNFLDDIALTREKLTSVEGTATVTLEKAIIGLKYSEARDLAGKLSFRVKNRPISGADLTWQWSGTADSYGTYTGSIVISIPQSEFGKLTLQENATSGNSLDVTGYDRNTSLFIDGNNTGSSESGTVTIGNRDSKTVSFKNVYSVQSGGGGGQEDEKTLSHEKYIKRNSNGTYDITLNASGTVGTHTDKALVDIVLVVDTSSSMKGDNIDNSKAAITKMVQEFNKKDTVDVRYRLVTFGTDAKIQTEWVNGNSVNTTVSGISIKDNQGTNYDKGFQKAKDALAGAREKAKKIVIFLTDGKPTFHGDSWYSYEKRYYVASGRGNNTSINTLNAAYNSAKEIECDQFYAVGVGLETEIKIYNDDDINHTKDKYVKEKLSGKQILQGVKNSTNNGNGASGEAWNLDKPSELSTKFESIVGKITTLACENVVISDTLSKYVDVTDSSKLHVKIAQKNSNGDFTSKYDKEFTLNGGTVFLNGTQIATANYNNTTKTATLTFVPTYQLEKDYYYYITITNVTPTEKAFDEYQTGTSYNATGASPSDASANGYYATTGGTSSGNKGFKSNATATVSYTYNNTSHTETYTDPVIQVETIAVEKKWVGIDADDIKNQVVLVQLIDKDGEAVSGKILKLTNNNNFKGSFAVEETNNYGGVRELKQDNQGTITYEGKKYSMVDPKGTTTINGNRYKVTYSEYKNEKQTITNTRNSEKIKILKTGTNTGLKLPGAEFTLKDSKGNLINLGNNTTGTYTSDGNGLVIEGELNTGTYKLEEIKSPDGYVLLPGVITITVSSEGDNKVTASGPSGMVSVKKSDEGVYEITVKNEVLYNLPSTGHTGIFNILMSGILLMFAGILIIYKMKGKEVLKK